MTVFVLGATGALGRRLLPLLTGAGHRVVATTRDAGRRQLLAALGAEPCVVDALDADALAAAVGAARPDVAVAQVTRLSGDFLRLEELVAENARVRREATLNLIAAAASAGVRRVVAQGIAFSYAPGEGLAGETEPFREEARGAHATDEAVLGSMGEGVVARYGYFYGPGTWYWPDGQAGDALRGGVLRVPSEGEESLVHVDDAAAATALLVERGRPGAYNVVDDDPAPRLAWMSALASAAGAPPPGEAEPAGPPRRGASSAKIAEELGWRPRFPSWRDGFREGA